jgi:predicted transposase/invertase (TIGR01784 family)
MDPAIQKAEEKFCYVSNDKEILRAYHMREMAMSDYTTGMYTAKQEGLKEGLQKGLKEGLQKGLKEGLQKVAKEMKASTNMSANQISKFTGLSIDEIERL